MRHAATRAQHPGVRHGRDVGADAEPAVPAERNDASVHDIFTLTMQRSPDLFETTQGGSMTDFQEQKNRGVQGFVAQITQLARRAAVDTLESAFGNHGSHAAAGPAS